VVYPGFFCVGINSDIFIYRKESRNGTERSLHGALTAKNDTYAQLQVVTQKQIISKLWVHTRRRDTEGIFTTAMAVVNSGCVHRLFVAPFFAAEPVE
jgi:hypothetical protein